MTKLDADWKSQYVAAIKKGMLPEVAALAFTGKTMEVIRTEMAKDPAFRELVEDFDKSSSHNVSVPALPNSTDIRELASAVEADVFNTYYYLMMSDSTPPSVRKACCDALADRARGKPAGDMIPMAPPVPMDTTEVVRRIAYLFSQAKDKGVDLNLPFLDAEVIEEKVNKEDEDDREISEDREHRAIEEEDSGLEGAADPPSWSF